VLLSSLCLAATLLAAGSAPQPAPGLSASEEKRLQNMKFDEIASALGVREGGRIADLGAGEGIFTAALAAAVGPAGRVYAVEISEAMLKQLRKRATKNVEVIHGDPDNPKLPEGSLDAVLLVDTYH
jgi:ubiquinone/menaquinone biosynthesis C-methylase UbiE